MISSMGKQLAAAFGFTVNPESAVLFGNQAGYMISAVENTSQRMYYLTFPARPSQGVPALLPQNFLGQLKAQDKQIAGVMAEGYALYIAVKMKGYSKTLAAFQRIFQAVIGYFQQYGFVSCCMECGTTEAVGVYALKGSCQFLCDECAANAQARLQEMAASQMKVISNLPMGLLGAFLASLIGVAAWVLVFQLGYISGFVGLLLLFCALKGYEKLGGCMDRKGAIAVAVLSLIMVFASLYLCYGIEIFKVYQEDGFNIFQCLGAVPAVIEDNGLAGSFIRDLLIGWLFTGAAGAGMLINVIRGSKMNSTVTRLG